MLPPAQKQWTSVQILTLALKETYISLSPWVKAEPCLRVCSVMLILAVLQQLSKRVDHCLTDS